MSEEQTIAEVLKEQHPNLPADHIEAEALENAMLQKEEYKRFAPEEVAATLYGLYLPKFMEGIARLSHKKLRKMVYALVETPLCEVPYKFDTELEKDTFTIGMRLFDAKAIMILSTYNQNIEKLYSESPEKAFDEFNEKEVVTATEALYNESNKLEESKENTNG